MSLKTIAILLLFIAPGAHASTQTEYWKTRPPRVGDAAPPFQFAAVISPGRNGASDAAAYSSQRLRGRVVVLDFFASWCAPCIASIPHMNELMRQTGDLPVTYVAVGGERADVLTRTLARHPMDAPVLHDADGSVSDAFWVSALPHVVVVDRSGRIARITHPSKLTRDTIAQAAAPGPPAEAQTDRPAQPGAPRTGGPQKPLASVAIHATENRAGQIRHNATTGELLASGVDASRLIRTAWDVVETELEIKAELPDAVYDVHVIPPAGSPGAAGRMLQAALDALFRTTSRKERRSVPGHRLSIAAGASPLRDSAGGRTRITLNQGGVEFDNVPIADIVRRLGVLLGGPVANDTGLTGRYSLHLEWQGSGADAIVAALQKAGFTVERDTLPLDVVVVESAKQP